LKNFNVLIALFFLFSCFSQELPPIKNFFPKDYNAENQNWSISQSAEKLIYVANSKGLLEYNGANWKLYPTPNESILRSVKVVDDLIYTGCFMDFGYWKKNSLGQLEYTSLASKIDHDVIEDEEFWNIIAMEDWMVFQSLKRIYIYNVKDSSVTIIDSKNTIPKIFKVGQSIYFQRMGQGIFKIDYGKDVLLFDDGIVKEDEVINIFKTATGIVILTQNNGFYDVQDNQLIRSTSISNEFVSNGSLYAGIQLKNKHFLLGTISNGLTYLDQNGALIYQIDQSNGLANNTVLSLFEDVDENIWLGLDNGISYVNSNAPFKVFHDYKGVLGSVYASKVHNGMLYLGTNQGLFYRSLLADDEFKFINGTQGQVWSLNIFENTLFCGHNSGTFIISDGMAQKIGGIPGTWTIAEIADEPNLLLQGNYDGLYILEKNNQNWKLRNKLEGFSNSSRYFEKLDNKIFVNHEYKGVFELSVDRSLSRINSVAIDTSLKGANSGLISYNGSLLFGYKKGIYAYNSHLEEFQRDSVLSAVYTEDEYLTGKLISNKKSNSLWIFTNTNISYVNRPVLANTLKVKSIPLTKKMREGIVGYENIMKFPDKNIYLIGTTSGYLTADLDKLEIKDFQIRIGEVLNGPNKINLSLVDTSLPTKFSSDQNNLKVNYYSPEFNKLLTTHYQYQLKGLYDDWSDWSDESETTFENLPYGDYVFKVRARIGNKMASNSASFSFSIAKPWYVSNTLIVLYILGVFLFSIFMHNVYKRYYKKQQEKLILKNKKELELSQVRNEKEIIKIRNEQLETEFKSKSKELAVSAMSIIKKNELLNTIKQELDTVKDKNSLKPVISIIDKSLKKNDDWELFKEAFDNADADFLKNIKKIHRSLSPSDLKLCAYLRLNLSSKEIANLLNISSRSVEIKRYRLRKKLNLKHKDNLVTYILEF
tara:strand:+ start:13269 stop:16064 length:2796 start_codon:yes stop_codon:yes gene_type:complete